MPTPSLTSTYWYVRTEYLPALQMSATDTEPTSTIDQTVWQITGSKDGYFWGNCAVLMYDAGTTPTDPPEGLRLVGSILLDGTVHITFMPINLIGAAISTIGMGKMKETESGWAFEMQMSSGMTELAVHWAFMYETKEGEESWNKLPGTDYSVPDFLAAAGF